MNQWMTYFGELILVTAVSGLLYHIVPEGNMKKHLHFVISLCVLVTLAVPMFSVLAQLPEVFEQGFEQVRTEESAADTQLEETLIAASKKEIESALCTYISEVYKIDADRISAETVLDAEDRSAIEIRKIDIVIYGNTQTPADEIRRALEEMFLGKSEITVSVRQQDGI
jgi:hypothetical protein